jgi:hypothetical protein
MDKIMTLTKAQLRKLGPCAMAPYEHLFPTARTRVTARQALDGGVSIPDLLWVAAQMGRKDRCVRFALECAQRVAHLNTDPRVQAALDATKAWLDDPCEATARAAGDAARAAWAAAWDARAARAAWAAAWASGDAAGAAWAAGAAMAAMAAARAAWDAEEQAQREIFIRIFCAEGEVVSNG